MSGTGPQTALSTDGARLHLNHGPIDLIVECDGGRAAREAAFRAATNRFEGLLDELVAELPLLRTPVSVTDSPPGGVVARRMFDATAPYRDDETITAMAAVAGSVADEIGAAVAAAADLDRWVINNGGDIAVGLAPDENYRVGLVSDPRSGTIESTVVIDSRSGIGGIATSGRHGRSFSFGIADAVTVLAATAAAADAAATIIANHVDLGSHPEITREPANSLDPDSDLGVRPITVDVGTLTTAEVRRALSDGLAYAESCVDGGLIRAAALRLAGQTATTTTDLWSCARPNQLPYVGRGAQA
jgi:ApbE superfamily uncharacterized protein (UPF0280 family)